MERPVVSETRAGKWASALGYMRLGVGLGLIAAPKAIAQLQADEEPSGSLALLMRTVGIRDLVLGIGTVVAARSPNVDEVRRWVGLGLLSDALDVIAGASAVPLVGRRGALIAAGVPVPVILSDLWTLAMLSSRGNGSAG